jgi:hypothetical protein
MSEIDQAGRALLALASDAHDPTDADRARVRAALATRLGTAAGLGLGTVVALGATAKASAGAAGSALATKLVGVAVAITTAVGVGAGIQLARRAADAPAAAPRAGAPEIDVPRRAPVTAAAAPARLPAPAPEQPTAHEASRAAPNDVPARGPSPVPPERVVATAPPPDTEPPALMDTRDLPQPFAQRRVAATTGAIDPACAAAARRVGAGVADEARLVQDGVRALRAGQPACALSLFDAHARDYPDGVLAEEREAERALSLAELGRIPEARQAAAAFLRKHPASPLGVRLRHRIRGLDGGDESTSP